MTERLKVLPERIRSKIAVRPSGCWEWSGALTRGYGRVRFNGRSALAHRVIYELLAGHVAADLDLDHLCRNTICVNPDHLEPVTHRENIRRGRWNAGAAQAQLSRTACANGHPYTAETLYIPPASSRRQRQCRICRREAKRRYNQRRAA